jgi:hypothetical protein
MSPYIKTILCKTLLFAQVFVSAIPINPNITIIAARIKLIANETKKKILGKRSLHLVIIMANKFSPIII